ncbi:InlB B-repeat-containing protein [Bifidobacterium sp. UMB1197]|nr:InlB B-repeat-containing protein [Bifidobacterium sp. UMB1197]
MKALVKKTMGLLLATLVAFGVTAGTTQAFAGGRAATVKPGELKKNDKNAKQRDSQLTTNSSESQSLYEYTKVISRESYMKDAEIDVYSVKDENGKAAAVITNTYKNTGRFFPQLTGVSEYKATANTGWVFKGWKYKQFLYGMDHGNLHGIFYSFSESSANKGNEYTSGEVISVNRTRGIGETAVLNKRIYNIYANLNPTIKASAGEGGSITPDGTKEVQYGENQKYDFTANEGYVIDSLKVDGVDQKVEHKASGSYEFKAVKSPHKIEVSFAKAYTVTYTDGVDNEEIFKDQVTNDILSGSETPKFNGTPSRAGYVFSGWTPKVADKVTANATYTATWKKDPFTVTFKDGDKTQTVKVENGKAIDTDTLTDQSMPQNPTKTGHTFKEWNTQKDGQGTAFTGTTPVNNDLTVYAIYTKNPVTPPAPTPGPKTPDPKQPQTPTPPTAPQPQSTPKPEPKPQSKPAPKPTQPPTPPTPGPDPKGNGNNNGSESVAPDSTDIPELNIGGGNGNNGGNDNNTNGSGNGNGVGGNANNGANNGTANVTSNGASVNANGSSNSGANRSGSSKLQATDARSADALPNTGSNASGITFAFFGAMVFGMFAASGAAANCKRAKHLR